MKNKSIDPLKYEPYIKSVVRKTYEKYKGYHQIQLDDLMSEGYLALYKTYLSYRKEKGTFFAYLKVCLYWRLFRYLQKEIKYIKSELTILDKVIYKIVNSEEN